MMKLVVLVAGDSVRGIGVVATCSVVCAGLCFLGQEAQGRGAIMDPVMVKRLPWS